MSGVGAHKTGGRWNNPKQHVVYTSGNLSLAMLELLVNVDDAAELPELSFVYHSVSFPESSLMELNAHDLPFRWASQPSSPGSKTVGDEWLKSLGSLVLAVPSVVTPAEYRHELLYMNFLINPNHPDAHLLEVGEVLDLHFDQRLI